MLKIFKNKYSLFWSCKNKLKKERFEKPNKKKFLLLIPENIVDRVLGVCKTKIPTEYRKTGIMCFKN